MQITHHRVADNITLTQNERTWHNDALSQDTTRSHLLTFVTHFNSLHLEGSVARHLCVAIIINAENENNFLWIRNGSRNRCALQQETTRWFCRWPTDECSRSECKLFPGTPHTRLNVPTRFCYWNWNLSDMRLNCQLNANEMFIAQGYLL